MKNRSGILKIFMIISSVIFLFACDVLVTDPKPRTNPNDQNTTIQPPYNVSAAVNVDSTERVYVDINWEWTNNGNETYVIGFVVMRKAGSAPESVYDGDFVEFFMGTENQYCSEYIDEDEDYPVGRTVYYSVFSYAAKTGDENELDSDEKLNVDESGILRNAQNYYFNGPVYDSVDIYAYADLGIQNDGFIDSGDVWTTGADNIAVGTDAGSAPSLIGAILFDNPDAYTDVDVIAAYLRLRVFSDGSESTIEIAPFIYDWQNSDWAEISDTDADADDPVDYGSTVGMIATWAGGDYCYADVTGIFKSWTDGTINNYGLRLYKSGLVDNIYRFYSSEDADQANNRPRLRVYYMTE